ncbi:hypothetical protein T11_8710 [Trichinella zimbabwensis]|uniref:Uncharacterized protein n=1 Tax=Trichinella zimbabwensis TaxID=268475 RepID=A0A0V1GXV0_9BILA|nr:hypothetical protein T11_8710 [Trichinella zimbabwensis]
MFENEVTKNYLMELEDLVLQLSGLVACAILRLIFIPGYLTPRRVWGSDAPNRPISYHIFAGCLSMNVVSALLCRLVAMLLPARHGVVNTADHRSFDSYMTPTLTF